jgi:hypothetical protein
MIPNDRIIYQNLVKSVRIYLKLQQVVSANKDTIFDILILVMLSLLDFVLQTKYMPNHRHEGVKHGEINGCCCINEFINEDKAVRISAFGST